MTYSIIQKSQLEGAHRLDAEYFQPEYLSIGKNIEKRGFLNFREIITSFGSGRNLPQVSDDRFTKFIRTQNVRPIIIDGSGISFTKEKFIHKLNYGDILFVRVGEGVGNNAIITKNFQNSTFSDNVIRVKIRKVNPFYVSVLLNSKIGFLLMEQVKKGSARSLISRENLNSLKIPNISEKEQTFFENIVNQSEDLIIESENFYSQAENLLLEKLGLENFEIEDDLSYIVNLQDVKSAHRVDAEYFQPKYKLIEERLIKNFRAKKIKDFDFIEITTGQYSEEYIEAALGKPYIRGTDLSRAITIKLDNLVYIEPKKQLSSKKAKCGDVVVTRVGTIGISARLPEEVEGGTISDNLIRLRFPEERLNSYYVSLFLNSIGSQFMVRESRGSVQPRLNQETLKEIVLPVLPKNTQQEIADLVRKSHSARKKAKELLEEAKTKVENLIEEK